MSRRIPAHIHQFVAVSPPTVADILARCTSCHKRTHSPFPDGRCGACTFPPNQDNGRHGREVLQ